MPQLVAIVVPVQGYFAVAELAVLVAADLLLVVVAPLAVAVDLVAALDHYLLWVHLDRAAAAEG